MSTRAGTSYQPDSSMDNPQETLLRTISEQLAQMSSQLSAQLTNQLDSRLNQFEARLDAMERAQQPRSDPDPGTPVSMTHPRRARPHDSFEEPNPRRDRLSDPYDEPHPRRARNHDPFDEPNPRRERVLDPFDEPHPRRVQQPDPCRDHPPRRAHQEFAEMEDRAFKSIRLEAPTFDGTLDTKVYLDWEKEMDQYFEWYEMTEGRKFKFAKLRLVRQARMYWDTVERLVTQRGQEPIATWGDLKAKLREKYIPVSYHQRLLDQWHRLIQGNKSATEYIA